ncbi:MAG: hypothetical protein KDB53_21615 [Planctomycetes bacterium]|nr:hypothetical protein [Planctomycetota bacterium]
MDRFADQRLATPRGTSGSSRTDLGESPTCGFIPQGDLAWSIMARQARRAFKLGCHWSDSRRLAFQL